MALDWSNHFRGCSDISQFLIESSLRTDVTWKWIDGEINDQKVNYITIFFVKRFGKFFSKG